MDFSDIFRIVNFAVAVFMILGGIAQFFNFHFSDVIKGVYLIIFGLGEKFWLTVATEVQIPPQVARYASFMFSFLGRGIFYVFIGSVIVGNGWYRIIPGVIVGAVGLAYVVLEYIPSIEPPANMRDADAGWGAEQV
ncbi:Golgi apparatus membrane protein TVP15 [Clohesyomyces aquaticus]|uniref:Golgi apparatus membrane protein TVP15 n=1 Tax=Clohesyomyces aquaticus TaxID=1231657 RepID=A0A1Y2A2U3_9PLEO|nr:Golgi apparatus membrane protein TVP15 [Clohesyomyces aquaticus]